MCNQCHYFLILNVVKIPHWKWLVKQLRNSGQQMKLTRRKPFHTALGRAVRHWRGQRREFPCRGTCGPSASATSLHARNSPTCVHCTACSPWAQRWLRQPFREVQPKQERRTLYGTHVLIFLSLSLPPQSPPPSLHPSPFISSPSPIHPTSSLVENVLHIWLAICRML